MRGFMRNFSSIKNGTSDASVGAAAGCAVSLSAALILSACSGVSGNTGGGTGGTQTQSTYTLTVSSANPSLGVAMTIAPADANGAASGSTSLTRSYKTGTSVTITAPAAAANGNTFSSWTGCTGTNGMACVVAMSANTTVTANYSAGTITGINVTPNAATLGTQVQFTATVTGTGNFSNAVTWSVAAPGGSTQSPGTLSSTGLYTTPYPAPPTVNVTATTSTQDTTKSGSVVVTLSAPALATGPGLTVDVGSPTHAINPYIYGMNAYDLSPTTASTANITVARWGGDGALRGTTTS